MKYIYGPVKSRRIGFSLGLSLVPRKRCGFDCIYCQLGRTTHKTIDRQEHLKIEDILEELKSWLANNPQEAATLNYITLSGSGEPTLNSRIGELISRIKEITSVPVAVITNASLLHDAGVRGALLAAGLIVPSLDSVSPKAFNKIDRPLEGIHLEEIIKGIIALRRQYRGKLWLEVMLVKGINDDLRQIKKLKAVIEEIRPDKIQLNSPVRATAEPGLLPVARKKLEKIKEILGDRCEIV